MAFVVDRAPTVGGRRAVRRGDLARLGEELLRRRLTSQELLGPGEVDRRQSDGAQRDAGVGDPAALDPDRRRGCSDRPVAGAALDLLVCAAAARSHRDPNLGEQLPIAHRSGVRPDVEVLHAHYSLSGRSSDHHAGLDRAADGRQVLRRIGLTQGAADGSAVAHDRVGDHQLGIPEDREVAGEQLGFQELHVPCQGSDPDLAVLLTDECELRQVVDVDQVRRIRQAQLHHRQQAVPARDHTGAGAELLERGDHAVDARRALVVECRRGLQVRPPI